MRLKDYSERDGPIVDRLRSPNATNGRVDGHHARPERTRPADSHYRGETRREGHVSSLGPSTERSATVDVLEIGAGERPHPDATATLDIREDLDHIDYPGVDIGTDRWPLADESVGSIRAHHVLEHVPPHQIGHIWREIDRVLVPGGEAFIELPHAGTWAAATDITHEGTGGTTPEVAEYFGDGDLEDYWPELNWSVNAYAEVTLPSFVRESLRIQFVPSRPRLSYELVKVPFVDAVVRVEIRKRSGSNVQPTS